MKKGKLLFFFVLLSLLLLGCSETKPVSTTQDLLFGKSVSSETAPFTQEEVTSTEEPVFTEPSQGGETPEETLHSHRWNLVGQTPSTCKEKGHKEYVCSCGNKKQETLPLLSHNPTSATCVLPGVCTACGVVVQNPLGHSLDGKVCTRCHTEITSPFFVLGREFDADESKNSILAKLGTPTELVKEGNQESLIYADDLTRFTVVQVDKDGLWGFFTMDPAARVNMEGEIWNIASHYPNADANSDAYYRLFPTYSYRIYSFRDKVGTGQGYGMWVLCGECVDLYDYMTNPDLYGTFSGQSRISYYYVNALRSRHGAKPLLWSSPASQVASEYCSAMIEGNFFHHDGSYLARLQEKGVKVNFAGENISQGYINAFFVCDAYYNSPSHRQNLLDVRFTHVGMGYQRKADPLLVYGGQVFYS